jgi:ATP-dependent Lon protease
VLCLVGPPGVGKTSLGRSVAEAMGRAFTRFSVGGVRDESEIRGHRRTYVGAMPGKILQAIKRAGAPDCLFLIDEIDKVGSDARGDPASALLEVLDPSQNDAFTDHYLDVPFDLSRVFFVATANDVSTIPGPLQDRMEIVRLSGYTRLEKLEIARRHLVPEILAASGLTSRRLAFPEEGLLELIDRYTREAGVRGLRRQLSRLARRRALEVTSPGPRRTGRLDVTPGVIADLLGAPPYAHTARSRDAAVGVMAGLAWTPSGGDLLFIEATLVPGTGKVKVTGRLGEVMRESAEAAMTYVRSRAKDLRIDPERFTAHDVHVHVPDGATPKDGPSAGVTIAACLASLYTGRPARPEVAMTGEITLKGRVLPVGGVKEKVLAAHRAGIQVVLLPEENRRDLEQIPAEVQAGLVLRFTRDARENIDAALLPFFLPEAGEGLGSR